MAEDRFGTPSSYIWLHQSLKWILLDMDTQPKGIPEFYFDAPPGEVDSQLAVDELYKETARVRAIHESFYGGLTVNGDDVKEVLPTGSNGAGDRTAGTHHFDLSHSTIRLLTICPLEIREGQRPLPPAPTPAGPWNPAAPPAGPWNPAAPPAGPWNPTAPPAGPWNPAAPITAPNYLIPGQYIPPAYGPYINPYPPGYNPSPFPPSWPYQ